MARSLTKENIEKLIYSDYLSNEEIIETIKEEMGINIDPNLPKEEMVDEVWRVYQEALEQLEQKTAKAEVDSSSTNRRKKRRSYGTSKKTRKDFIIDLISKAEFTRAEVEEQLSEEYNYKVSGKSPKTRVSRVLRELEKKGKLGEEPNGVLFLKD